VQEDERQRVARELHDNLIQLLAGIGMDLGKAADTAKPGLKKELRAFQARVVETAEIGRRVAYELHPSELEDLGLEAALRAYCERLAKEQGFAFQVTSRNVPGGLPKEIASCLYRVAQESLHNIVKHAKTQRAAITLEGGADSIRLSVQDQGVGFSVRSQAASSGLGIVSMRERAQLANGTFAIASEPGHGTRVSVEVPLRRKTR